MDVISFSGPKMKASRTIVYMGLLFALSLILKRFMFGPSFLQFGIAFLATTLMGYYLGPVLAAVDAALADQVGTILGGGMNFPLFTLNAIIAALIYGMFLHGHKVTWWRVLIPVVLVVLIVNIWLNTWWIDLLGTPWQGIIVQRTIKNLVMIPIQWFLTFTVLKTLERVQPSLHV